MLYLRSFRFPDEEQEVAFRFSQKRTCYTSIYPFGVLPGKVSGEITFDQLTIFHGGNGCGKSTLLNCMAEKLKLKRESLYNRTSFYEDYLRLCNASTAPHLPKDSRMITSDDVFDFVLNLRSANEGLDRRREELFEEWVHERHTKTRFRSMEDYDALRQTIEARRTTQSEYVRRNLHKEIREHSNGESALLYFSEHLKDGGLYLLDEPENSLSPKKQMELAEIVENCVRFFDCQIVMATHSPFFLSLRGARLYDMDQSPMRLCRWTELETMQMYYHFFMDRQVDFEKA